MATERYAIGGFAQLSEQGATFIGDGDGLTAGTAYRVSTLTPGMVVVVDDEDLEHSVPRAWLEPTDPPASDAPVDTIRPAHRLNHADHADVAAMYLSGERTSRREFEACDPGNYDTTDGRAAMRIAIEQAIEAADMARATAHLAMATYLRNTAGGVR